MSGISRICFPCLAFQLFILQEKLKHYDRDGQLVQEPSYPCIAQSMDRHVIQSDNLDCIRASNLSLNPGTQDSLQSFICIFHGLSTSD